MLVLFKNPLIVRIPSREDLGMPPLVHPQSADRVMCPACDAAAVLAADAASRLSEDSKESFWLTEPRKFGRAALGRAPLGLPAQPTAEVAP